VIVGVGATKNIQMSSKKRIQSAQNEKESVARLTEAIDDASSLRVQGVAPGFSIVKLKDIDGLEEEVEIIVQVDLDLLKSILRRAVPTANIDLIPGLANITIVGSVKHLEDIDTITRIAQSAFVGGVQVLNAMTVGGVSQVQLDVVVALVSRSEDRRLGFNFGYGGITSLFQLGNQTGNVASTTLLLGQPLQAGSSAASNVVFGTVPGNFYGFLQALRTENLAKVLSEPKLVTMSGRSASFLSGGQQAVPQITGAGVGGGIVGTELIPFGTRLDFLPIVRGNGKIYLEVSTSLSSLNAANGFNLGTVTVFGRDEQNARTCIEVENGQSFAIAGLIQTQVQASAVKVPFFGDMPFLAPFLGRTQYNETETELVILVTPHLVDPMDCNQVPKYLPGRETRSPDDYELFLEMILEAPRGQRKVFENKKYKPAWKNDPTADKFPCGVPDGAGGLGCGHGAGHGRGCGTVCGTNCGTPGCVPACGGVATGSLTIKPALTMVPTAEPAVIPTSQMSGVVGSGMPTQPVMMMGTVVDPSVKPAQP
jgi:pilus assembly protein CpaC